MTGKCEEFPGKTRNRADDMRNYLIKENLIIRDWMRRSPPWPPAEVGASTGVMTRTSGGPIHRLPSDVSRAVASYRGAAGPADPRRVGGGRPWS
jgi:hypothetical protein